MRPYRWKGREHRMGRVRQVDAEGHVSVDCKCGKVFRGRWSDDVIQQWRRHAHPYLTQALKDVADGNV